MKHKKSNSLSDEISNKDQSKNKRIYILGDSMFKSLKAWEMSEKLKNSNVCVRHFAVPRLGLWKTT